MSNCKELKLKNNWTYYLHIHDTRQWDFESYNQIMRFNSVEHAILLNDESFNAIIYLLSIASINLLYSL